MASAIRVGIVGLGRSGWDIHAATLRGMPELYQIVAVADPIAQRATECGKMVNCPAYMSCTDLLKDDRVELVVVASPNRHHARQSRQALNAGKHVLCEKPFGLTVADVDDMIAAAERAGRVLQPFQQRRYEPDFRKVKELCDSGLFGQLHYIRICWHGFKRRWDWQTLTAAGGGALNNNGPHPIDHAVALFGDGQPQVWCRMQRCLCSGDAEDWLKIILTGPNKPTVEVELMDAVAYGHDRWLVCGTAGGLRGDAGRLEWKYVDWSQLPERPVEAEPTPDRSYNSESLPWQTGSWTPQTQADSGAGAAPARQPVIDLYTDLWRTIRQGTPQVITPQDVRRRVTVMEQARRVAGNGESQSDAESPADTRSLAWT